MKTILITGGTGLIGRQLTDALVKKKYKVVICTRDPSRYKDTPDVRYAAWDIKSQTMDAWAIESADHIFHLAGAGVFDKRWSEKYKKEIISSRTESSRLIGKMLQQIPNKIKSITSASAIGWYGKDKGEKAFVETDPAADDFLGKTCVLWEKSISEAAINGIPVCLLRTGIVLSNNGGALPEFKKSLHFGIAGIMGDGKQHISWIHIDDLCRLYIFSIENMLHGSFNAVAPAPVTNKNLVIKLAEKMRGRFYIPVHIPAFLLKLILGERSIEILKSATVSAEKIRSSGFTFLYPAIEPALTNLINKKN